METSQISGILNVHSFGCSISNALEPLLVHKYADIVPVLTLSYDGQQSVHQENRIEAFMECVMEKVK